MDARLAFDNLVAALTPRYGAGEAQSITKIIFEDAFQRRPISSGAKFSEVEQARYLVLKQRLTDGEPVQYVLGQADFFGLKFKVNASVLIPRQETEELVAGALKWLKNQGLNNPAVADIGLGSGCIAISLQAKRRDILLYGLEKSESALQTAVENARKLIGALDFHFFHGDILDTKDWNLFPSLDLIISNPPYIPRSEQGLIPEHVLAWEPALALFVEQDDALLFYRAIAEFALKKLKPGGALFFECNEFNAGEVASLLQNAGFVNIELQKDLSGADRMLKARIAPE